ncbi:MAG: hypothetical protein H6744_18285 [Deltaproteobacteria bacterium]|nr:hypothetical protein [Deltaproteobacteria bacterium]MCB9788630.1 hypothetical protein [Deltaproteobacteria bacterium]
MDKLYQERMARLVLDRLLESGELRSVASQRALALRIHYLPVRMRFQVPADDDFLPLLDPNTRDQAVAGLRDALVRVIEHEESDHWVISDPDLEIEVSLREGSRRARVEPVYEPELEDAGHRARGLGEPRLQIGAGGRRIVFRHRQGLLKVDLGPRAPQLVVFEAPDDEEAVAYLYATTSVQVRTEDGTSTSRPRTRVPVDRDMTLVLQRSWARPWKRRVEVELRVLGLARLARRELFLESTDGSTEVWDRNRDRRFTIGSDLLLDAGELDELTIHDTGETDAVLRWFGGRQLVIPAGGHVTVQASHVESLTTAGGQVWSLRLPEGAHAPPPRLLTLVGELVQPPESDGPSDTEPALFRFEQAAARVFQESVVLSAVSGSEVRVAVKSRAAVGPLAEVALDDCGGAKLRLLRPGGAGAQAGLWHHITDFAVLEPSAARLEAVGEPLVVFAVERPLGVLSTDPADQLRLGGWRVGLAADALALVSDGAAPAVVDGIEYAGSARVRHRPVHRVRAGEGVFRIVRGDARAADR